MAFARAFRPEGLGAGGRRLGLRAADAAGRAWCVCLQLRGFALRLCGPGPLQNHLSTTP